MKKKKIDSDILDDNYFPEKMKPSEIKNTVSSFFKIIGFTILFSSLFMITLFFIVFFLSPNLFPSRHFTTNKELTVMILTSYSPFLFLLYVLNREKEFNREKWKISVLVLSSIISLSISLFMYLLFNIPG